MRLTVKRRDPAPRALIAAVICLLILCGCEKKETAETFKVLVKGIDLHATGYVAGRDKTNSLKNVFDGNPGTGCFLQREYGDVIQVTFTKPVYLSGLALIADASTIKENAGNYERAKHIRVFANNDPDEIFPAGTARYALLDTKNRQTVVLGNGFLKLMRVRTLAIEVENEKGRRSTAALWLNEMEPEFSDAPSYVPTVKLEEIAAKYAKENTDWSFDKRGIRESTQEEVMADLIYYALNGSKPAEKMFEHFSPPGADSGEWASFLKTWYDMEKSLRN
jgi:hypothetical protein